MDKMVVHKCGAILVRVTNATVDHEIARYDSLPDCNLERG